MPNTDRTDDIKISIVGKNAKLLGGEMEDLKNFFNTLKHVKPNEIEITGGFEIDVEGSNSNYKEKQK